MPQTKSVAKRGEPCPKCGQIHERCLGHKNIKDAEGHIVGLSPCKNYPPKGGEVCKQAHGGRAPQVRSKALERATLAEAQRAVGTYGLRVDIDPVDALLDEVCWTAGHVQWLRQVVQALDAEGLTWGLAEQSEKHATEFEGTDTLHKASVNVWLDLYRAERKHLVDVCATAIKVGIEERRIRIAERQGELIADVFRRVFEDPDLGLTEKQQQVGQHVASRHLRLLASSE